ncbi:hypothetical protein GON03_04440 [Nocardioides sp. MAH-18]|uniref:MarR family transcriptional regulator n=1 Tax=Nocardioides agri TaxID=2682843 RepID=A0A6L6XNU9_9ACTN|nr:MULTISPECIES: hypothetical protein [unclassified Nocardioides]MBA2953550.1 hypothetical protein [Nocardioides sp. CGMCC 1.13656]MVQ48417.1 hypothetical protein [Nocardioides sp. MAH-18]
MPETTDLNFALIHDYMLELGEFSTPAIVARRIGFSRVTVKKAFVLGVERGWYVTRDSDKHVVPHTDRPATEYKAVPRGT